MPVGSPSVVRFDHGGGALVDEVLGRPVGRHMVFLHGWGTNRDNLRGIGALFQHEYQVHLIDLPGFGEAPHPPSDWGTPNYTDLVQQYLTEHVTGPLILIGHSFGARVSLRLAARRFPSLRALVLMAAPGLPRTGWSYARVRRTAVRLLRKLLVAMKPFTGQRPLDWHTAKFGSRDYLAAGALRPILVRTVNEDLTESAKLVRCPVLLLWGEEDTETPPELAYRFQQLMNGRASVVILPHKDHYLASGTGSHLCAFKIRGWLTTLGDAWAPGVQC